MRVWIEIRAADGMQTKRESLKIDERETEEKKQREDKRWKKRKNRRTTESDKLSSSFI